MDPLQTTLNRTSGVAVKCYRCGYLWKYTSNLIYANCPSCRHAIKIEKGKVFERRENSSLGPRDQSQAKASAGIGGGHT